MDIAHKPAPGRRSVGRAHILALCATLFFHAALAAPVAAQPAAETLPAAQPGAETLPGAAQIAEAWPDDAAIEARIESIFDQLPDLSAVEVEVRAGVVHLTGSSLSAAAIANAEETAGRVEGVVAVRNDVARDARLETRLGPAWATIESHLRALVAGLPLLIAALLIVIAAWVLSSWLRRRQALWRRITPNAFVAELASGVAQLGLIAVGIILALMILDATALLTAALGAAGVLGLAVGFAVRDVIENYLASILLSLRQPFRPFNHVVINGAEGRVARLTSRATILLTIEGNHLRIPNADVFKATILNYTRNPERRFDFELGIDAEDDPIAAIAQAEKSLAALPFVLASPPAGGRIKNVGESNIVIEVWAWIDQRQSDFAKSRTVALAHVKTDLETAGFALPEPIYRVRMDARGSWPDSRLDTHPDSRSGPALAARPESPGPKRPAAPPPPRPDSVAPDASIDRFVAQERQDQTEPDLLDADNPTE